VVGTLPSLLGIAGVSHSPAGRVVVGLEDRVNPYRGVRRPPGLLRIRPLRAPTRVPWPIPTADRNAERPARPTVVGDPRPSDSRFAARGRIWPTLAGRPHTPTNEQGNVPLRPHHLLLNHPEVDFIPTNACESTNRLRGRRIRAIAARNLFRNQPWRWWPRAGGEGKFHARTSNGLSARVPLEIGMRCSPAMMWVGS